MSGQETRAVAAADGEAFDPAYYLRANDDVRAHGFDPLDHYTRFGRAEGRPANALQAARRFGRTTPPFPEAAAEPEAPGGDADPTRASRPLAATTGDIPAAAADMSAGDEGGAPETEAAPPAWFDARWYRDHYHDVCENEFDPYLHYVEFGFREGRAPNKALSAIDKLSIPPRHRTPRQLAAVIAVIARSGVFDANWYCEMHGIDPQEAIRHYVLAGAWLGFDPSPFFSTLDYMRANPDAARAGMNPLAHYVEFGFLEGRKGVRSLADTRLTTRIWLKGL